MIVSIAAAALAVQLSTMPGGVVAPVQPQASLPQASLPQASLPQTVQYRVPAYPPPCDHGWDLSARDGLCYPTGYLPPQEQAARQYPRHYRGGRYPVPCGHGTDLDSRDGQCYPTGTVPPQYQQGRQQYYGEGRYQRPQGRYYYRD
jgi:carbohydrate-selective porin OprB